jgi:hypothetical protein
MVPSSATLSECRQLCPISARRRFGFLFSASITTHASVFAVSPAGISSDESSLGWTCTESISCASRNLSSNGKRWKREDSLAHHLSPEPLHHLAHRLPLQWSVRNQALEVGAVAQHPSFADRSIAWKRRGEQTRQAAAAPQTILIDWFEPKWIQLCVVHCLLSICCHRNFNSQHSLASQVADGHLGPKPDRHSEHKWQEPRP